MNAERFAVLAEAYGGDIARWPVEVREAAEAWRTSHARAAMAVLAEAAEIDLWLDASRTPDPGPALREDIIQSARRVRAPARRVAMLVSGMGLLAACAAGVVFGSNLSSQVFYDPAAESVAQTQTAFDSVSYFDTSNLGDSAG